MWFPSRLRFLLVLPALIGLAATPGSAGSWQKVNPEGIQFLDFAEGEEALYAGTGSDGIYRSADRGRSWTKVASCFPGAFHMVPAIHASPGLLLASFEGGGVCVSRDGGDTWKAENRGLPQQPFLYTFARLGDTLFAGGTVVSGAASLFKSPVDSVHWVRADSGLPVGVRTVQRLLATHTGILVAGISNTRLPSAGSVFVSRDSGASWSPTPIPFPYQVYHLVHVADVLILATEHGIYRSEDFGAHWVAPSGDPPREEFYSLAVHGKEVYAGSGRGRIYMSRDYGLSWGPVETNLPVENTAVEALWLGREAFVASLGLLAGSWYLETDATSVLRRRAPDRIPGGKTRVDVKGRRLPRGSLRSGATALTLEVAP